MKLVELDKLVKEMGRIAGMEIESDATIEALGQLFSNIEFLECPVEFKYGNYIGLLFLNDPHIPSEVKIREEIFNKIFCDPQRCTGVVNICLAHANFDLLKTYCGWVLNEFRYPLARYLTRDTPAPIEDYLRLALDKVEHGSEGMRPRR